MLKRAHRSQRELNRLSDFDVDAFKLGKKTTQSLSQFLVSPVDPVSKSAYLCLFL